MAKQQTTSDRPVVDANLLARPTDDAPLRFPRATRLRLVSGVTMVLWVCSFAAFVVLVGSKVGDALLSALGVLASVFFTISFVAQSAANRRELRDLAVMAARSDVVAAFRPARRLRGVVAREAVSREAVGRAMPATETSRPGRRRDRAAPPR